MRQIRTARAHLVALSLAIALPALVGCASTDQFNKIAADVVGEAITASEQNRCTEHAPPCLSDDQFRAVNLELNRVSVAGREFTKLRIAGTASTQDVATFLGVVAEESAILSRTFPNGAISDVLTKLIELQAKAVKLLGGK